MPYIDPIYRPRINKIVDELFESHCNEGDTTYIVSLICHKFILQFPKTSRNYSLFSAVIGILECAKNEFVRTVLSPYEENKRIENGSISELDE